MSLQQLERPLQGIGDVHPEILDRRIGGLGAWRRADVRADDWRVPMTKGALWELDTIASALADYEGPIHELNTDALDWPATTELMVAVRMRLDQGIGLAILDRLPVERWGKRATTAISWLLTTLLAPAIMQKKNGARVYDVRDTGAKMAHGVRRSITNLEQEFHTDGSFLGKTPEFMGLACLNQAPTGGMSRAASLATVHDAMRERHPDLLGRLYRPFWWDRQAEHEPGDALASWHPIFATDGQRLTARYYDDYIRNGYRLMEASLDDEGAAALAAMKRIIEEPENWIEFRLEPGQVEYMNNHLLAHARTAFADAAEPDTKRHLLRYWLRSVGGITLEADAGVAATV